LTGSLQFLDDSKNTQRLAFGETVRGILNNGAALKLDKVSLIQSVRLTATKFVIVLAHELERVSQDDEITDRCHDGKCTFTSVFLPKDFVLVLSS